MGWYFIRTNPFFIDAGILSELRFYAAHKNVLKSNKAPVSTGEPAAGLRFGAALLNGSVNMASAVVAMMVDLYVTVVKSVMEVRS